MIELSTVLTLFIAGIPLGIMWSVAHDRRKAVDRLTKYLYDIPRRPDEALGCARAIKDIHTAGILYLRDHLPVYDAPGRVIARSVRRVQP